MTQTLIKLKSLIVVTHAGCRGMQFGEKFSKIENRQLYRLNAESAVEPRSNFCMSERYIACRIPV